MKRLRKLFCLMLAAGIVLLNTGAMFADTGAAGTDITSWEAGTGTDNTETVDELSGTDSEEIVETEEGSDSEHLRDTEINSDAETVDEAGSGPEETVYDADPAYEETAEEEADPAENGSAGAEGGPASEDITGEDENADPADRSDTENHTDTETEVLTDTVDTEGDPEAGTPENPETELKEGQPGNAEDSGGEIESDEPEENLQTERSDEKPKPEGKAEKADTELPTEKEADEKASAEVKADVTYTIRFNANGGSGTMPRLTGVELNTTDRIPVNAFTNSGEEGNYVRTWNTKADGSGSSYAPSSALSAVTADLQKSGKTSITLYAQWTASVTLNVRIQETHPQEAVFGIQTGGAIYSRYNGGNYIQKSSDGGNTWTRTIVRVSTDDEFAVLPRVYAQAGMSLSRPGYSNTNARAYNTQKDGSGVFLRANQTSAGQTNPVNTTTLNGGTPITEAGHTVVIYVYWVPVTYSLTVHNNAASVGLAGEERSLVYSGLKYGTRYYLCNSSYGPENETGYNWLLPSPKFCLDGYLFYGWNTEADGSGEWYSGFAPGFSDLTAESGGNADLYALWKMPDGISDQTVTLSNGAVITRGYSNFSDVDLMITKYFTGEGGQTDPGNIEYGINGGGGRLHWNPVYTGGQPSGDIDEETEEETETGAGLLYLTIDRDRGTKQIYDLGDASAYVILKDRAFDMHGNRYDIKITISGIKAADYSGKYDSGNLFLVRSSGSCNLYSERSLSSVFDVDIEILDPGASDTGPGSRVEGRTTVLYFADMDVPANAASRQFLGQPSEDHNTYAYYDPETGEVFSGAEHIEVSPDDSSRIFIAGDNLIHANVKDGMTQLTGTYYTGVQSQRAGLVDTEGNGVNLATEMTSAAVVFSTGRIRFRFGATHASTALFMDDIFVHVVSNVRDRKDFDILLENGTGGYIDHGGEGEISFARGSSPVYSITAESGYYIKDIWIDGVKAAENGRASEMEGLSVVKEGLYLTEAQYAFENIQTDHTIDVSFERMLEPADLILHKTCGNGERPADLSVMKDAEFRILLFKGIFTVVSEAESSGSPLRSWVFRTNDSGEIRMADAGLKVSGDDLFYDDDGNVCLPEGTLVIYETKAPEGFEIDDTRHVLTLAFDDNGNAQAAEYGENGEVIKTDVFGAGQIADPDIEIREKTAVSNAITVSKTICKEDYLEQHGIPGFVFEVSGTDITGKSHTFHRMILFDSIAEGSGTVTESVTLTGVPSGRYAVHELETLRYETVSIVSDGFDIEEADGINGYAYGYLPGNTDVRVDFTDRKRRWDEYSDASAVINHIG